ncbi:MAG: AbrB/MazE/SpoVT family DNA-binding domain-containing protein [Clostridia bacterium]|nr:AbrB/MazE/SpoVT family DNA-binding domain-containing protein [Clostridia bacterium]
MEKKQEKFIWTVKVSDKGQISIPKQAREVFDIKTGDTLILFGDTKRGIAIAKYEEYLQFANAIFKAKEGVEDD